MDVKISYFFIFGIISITTGLPANYNAEDYQYVRNDRELENILQSLTGQGKLKIASNYREDASNSYNDNRAGSSRYEVKSSPLYYKVDSPTYYESGENADEQPSIDNLQMINQFLKSNDDRPVSNNAQNLLEDLLSLDRSNKLKLLKPSDESENVNEVVALLGEIQRVSDEDKSRDYNVYGKAKGNNVRGNFLFEDSENPKRAKKVKPGLGQTKNEVMQVLQSFLGNKPQYQDEEYLNLAEDELSRNERNDRNVNSYNNRDGLRCNGKRCARTNVVNDDSSTRLRCRGSYCTRTRDDGNGKKLKYNSKVAAQKIKINDELDAVVLGLSDAERMLTKLAVPKQTRTYKSKSENILENVNFDNLLNSNIDRKDNVEAIVFDLTKVKNGDAVARQIKKLLTENSAGSKNGYKEYGNLVENHLKRGTYDLKNKVVKDRANSKTRQHKESNNNVYLPQWLLDDVVLKAVSKDITAERISRSLFPLTRQQKARMRMNRNRNNQKVHRIYRRSLDQDVGVPFHMEIQGLGQVNP